MAGLISITDCNLNAANAFYRIEAANPGMFNATGLLLSTPRNISVTFANAGNCQGLVIAPFDASSTTTSSANHADVRVCLEQIMGAVTTNAALDEVTFAAHGFADGQEVEFSATGGGITVNVKYFARVTGSSAPANTFFLYSTYAQALAGGAPGLINITGAVTPILYAIRADKTHTGNEICGGATANAYSEAGYAKPFTFTAPYAVDTVAGKWRFNVSQPGTGGATNWSIRTSDATNAFYVAWCDNVMTFSSGSDWVVFKDVVTMTASASLTGASNLSTGETTQSIAAIVCVGKNGITPSTVSNFLVPNAGSAMTLTINGGFLIGSHAGVKIGDSSTRWDDANVLTISIVAATSGTNTSTGFRDFSRTVGSESGAKQSLFFYGEYPAVEVAELAADVGTGATSCTTTVATGWVSGDKFFMGGIDTAGVGTNVVEFTVSSTSGTTVNFSPATATNTRKAGGKLVRSNGYGIVMNGPSTTVRSIMKMSGMSNLVMSGMRITNCNLNIPGSTLFYSYDDAANINPFLFEHICFEATATATRGFLSEGTLRPNEKGITIDQVNSLKGTFYSQVSTGARLTGISRAHTFTNCITLSSNFYSNITGPIIQTPGSTFTGNIFENSGLGNPQINAANCIVSNNIFWRSQNSTGALNLNNCSNLYGENNKFNGCVLAVYLQNTILNSDQIDCIFGNTLANTTDIDVLAGSYFDFFFESPTGNITINEANIRLSTPGSILRIADYNDTANDHRTYQTYGNTQVTGDLLSDTRARTVGSGLFALRFDPKSSTDVIYFDQIIPTGNIQNLTMTVSVWVYINNAAYSAGTHTMPTLRVDYDNGTVETAVAFAQYGVWQRLSVVFTPVTTFGGVDAQLEAATDATGTNAYVYQDDYTIVFPPSAQVSLAGLDKHRRGLPLTPTIVISGIPNIWDLSPDDFNLPGTFGQMLQPVGYGVAQAGGASSITLSPSASSTNDFYKYKTIYITGNTGTRQTAKITAYNGTTKVATVDPAWINGIPDSTSQYVIHHDTSLAHEVWDHLITDLDAPSGSVIDFVKEKLLTVGKFLGLKDS